MRHFFFKENISADCNIALPILSDYSESVTCKCEKQSMCASLHLPKMRQVADCLDFSIPSKSDCSGDIVRKSLSPC